MTESGAGVKVATRNVWQEATIESITVQTPTVKSFVLRPKSWPSFIAGQHIDVRLTAPDGYEAHRSYSITSAPETVGILEIAIERLSEGEVSPYFHDVAIVGDTVEVRGPFTEHFIWRENEHGVTLLIGGGSGIAPLMSMLRHRAYIQGARSMTVVYSARSWGDVIFRDELLQQETQQPELQLFLALTRDATRTLNERNANFRQRLDQSILQVIIASMPVPPTTCFVC
ncbi:MAG: FAD-binding oxidoreductase, partial [Gemmatimonadota bacterium]|nr:FAD-binding oxidoreductase [Gemmatimonadota bacterium]